MSKNHAKSLLSIIGAALLCALACIAAPAQTDQPAPAEEEGRAPSLPSPLCDSLQPPAGHKVSARVYALGVQIYRWSGASWDFVAPWALLFADAGYHGKVGTHYAGPTWESSRSKVVGRRLAGCTPDPTAIPWLLLEATSTEGPGVFNKTTYIQRVNTVGGLAPTTPGAFVGAEARMPYTTEYYFYRAHAQH